MKSNKDGVRMTFGAIVVLCGTFVGNSFAASSDASSASSLAVPNQVIHAQQLDAGITAFDGPEVDQQALQAAFDSVAKVAADLVREAGGI